MRRFAFLVLLIFPVASSAFADSRTTCNDWTGQWVCRTRDERSNPIQDGVQRGLQAFDRARSQRMAEEIHQQQMQLLQLQNRLLEDEINQREALARQNQEIERLRGIKYENATTNKESYTDEEIEQIIAGNY